MDEQVKYTCQYCHKVFVRESSYMNHKCDRMKKEDEFKTPNGQTAWEYYRVWMRYKNRVPPSSTAFLTSKYFRTFIKFVEFTKKVKLPTPEKFVWWTATIKNYQPTMWMYDDVYLQYIEFLDNTNDPFDQVTLSINTLLDYADNRQIDVSEIFEAINPNELLQLIRIRQVSPWLLLFSCKFKNMWINRLSTEQRNILEDLIQPDSWGEKLKNKPSSTKDKIKRCISELGI